MPVKQAAMYSESWCVKLIRDKISIVNVIGQRDKTMTDLHSEQASYRELARE
jgi:hypothetical protein